MEIAISRNLWISRSEGRMFIASQIEHLFVAVEVSVVMPSRHLLRYQTISTVQYNTSVLLIRFNLLHAGHRNLAGRFVRDCSWHFV